MQTKLDFFIRIKISNADEATELQLQGKSY